MEKEIFFYLSTQHFVSPLEKQWAASVRVVYPSLHLLIITPDTVNKLSIPHYIYVHISLCYFLRVWIFQRRLRQWRSARGKVVTSWVRHSHRQPPSFPPNQHVSPCNLWHEAAKEYASSVFNNFSRFQNFIAQSFPWRGIRVLIILNKIIRHK